MPFAPSSVLSRHQIGIPVRSVQLLLVAMPFAPFVAMPSSPVVGLTAANRTNIGLHVFRLGLEKLPRGVLP